MAGANLDSLRVKERELGGSGIITSLTGGNANPELSGRKGQPLTLIVTHPALSEGAIFTLWLTIDGAPDLLEGATFAGEEWPSDEGSFRFVDG
tara:strand:+ start:889 stop:1167 length:279 start_codon:yes stop_codon:yes gene_type:complete